MSVQTQEQPEAANPAGYSSPPPSGKPTSEEVGIAAFRQQLTAAQLKMPPGMSLRVEVNPNDAARSAMQAALYRLEQLLHLHPELKDGVYSALGRFEVDLRSEIERVVVAR